LTKDPIGEASRRLASEHDPEPKVSEAKSGNRFSEKDHAPTKSWIVMAFQRNAITI